MEIKINGVLKNEIIDYCFINKIDNVEDFTINMVKQGLTVEKYGSTPMNNNLEPKVIEKVIRVSDDVKIDELLTENDGLKKDIEILKGELELLKNKKDIYGE